MDLKKIKLKSPEEIALWTNVVLTYSKHSFINRPPSPFTHSHAEETAAFANVIITEYRIRTGSIK
jgi:hypothetical protein